MEQQTVDLTVRDPNELNSHIKVTIFQ